MNTTTTNPTNLIRNLPANPTVQDDRYGTLWETAGPETGLTQLSFAHVEVDVGKTIPPHYHQRMSELYHIVSGSGLMRLDGVRHEVRAGDTISLPPGTIHSLRNTGDEPIRLLVATSPAYVVNGVRDDREV